jgi:hypothetical protein
MGQISFGIGTFSILKMLNITFETINGFPTGQSATLPNSKAGLYLHREMAFWPPYSNLENGWQMASRDAVKRCSLQVVAAAVVEKPLVR